MTLLLTVIVVALVVESINGPYDTVKRRFALDHSL
jgi:hypothetical protein